MINRNDYFNTYKKNNYHRVPLDLRAEKYKEVKEAAVAAGESLNGYIKKAIDARLACEKDPKDL